MQAADEITLEERIAALESAVQQLIENDRIHQENQKELHGAVSGAYPRIVEGQDQAIATLNTNQKNLLELVKKRDSVIELLAESTKRHAEALDRIERLLQIQKGEAVN